MTMLDEALSTVAPRWTTYRLANSREDGLSGQRSFLDGGSAPLLRGSAPLVANSAPLQPHRAIESRRNGIGADEAELRSVAAPVADHGKVPPALMRSTIEQLCANRYLSAEELGRLLGRNPAKLRARFFSPMVERGELSLRHPESPNRPDQAYIAVVDRT